MKKIIPGLLIGALLIYYSLKGTQLTDVVAGFSKVEPTYIWFSLLLMILMQALRAWRWGLILKPLGRIGPLQLWAATCVGFLAITALPARLGELLRPYLVTRSADIRVSAALGTVFVERFLDGVTILAIASATAFFTSLPPWLVKANLFFLIVNIMLLAGMFCAAFRRSLLERLLDFLTRRLPFPWKEKLHNFFFYFLDGFQIIGDVSRLWRVFALSCLIWFVDAIVIYALFQAFNSPLPPVAAFVLMIILIIGIAIPTAPGFIGNWHFACILGLGLFGVARTEALTFAITYHFLAVGLTIILGLSFWPFLDFSFADLWEAAKGRGSS